MPKKVKAGTMIMVRHPETGRTLMVQRRGPTGTDQWSCPGGWLDQGESPVDGALRELREEVGPIRVTEMLPLAVTNDFHPEGHQSITIHYVAIYESGIAFNNSPKEIRKVEWRLLDDIPIDDLFLPLRNIHDNNLVMLSDVWTNDEPTESDGG